MKNLISFLMISCLLVITAQAQLDRSKRPEPGPAPTIELGESESFTLDNGLKVIVVENRKVPVISWQLTLDIDPVLEGDATGYVNFAGQLMREGTTNRTKQEIDEAIDFIGASLSTFSSGMFASSLTKHKGELLNIMQDVLFNPTFPEEELEKRITQTRTGLQTIKTDASSIAANIATTQVYGYDHPYGEVVTEETLDNITADKLKDYYNTYFKPNVSYLVIVGDIDAEEAKTLTQEYFGSWEPGEVPEHNYATPQPPAGNRVAFGAATGAVQSVVDITYPLELTPGHPNAIKVSVMNSILGGGVFSGRLMQNLREDKGYTYGARSRIGTDKLVTEFSARTEVRNSVTDSTVVEILKEMDRLINEPIEEDDLKLVKSFMNGSFARSLESPRTIARYALNIARYNLPEDYYANYLANLESVTVEEVQEMAKKYLKPERAVIVVAGNKDEVPETLTKFAANGEVEFFDPFGRPVVEEAKEIPVGVTVETVLNNYYEAIGGKEHFSKMNDLTQVMKTEMMGMELTITSYQKAPNKLLVETAMGGNVMSTQLFDGNKAIVKSPMGNQEFTEGPQFEALKTEAIFNREMNYKEHGIEKELVSIESVNGKDAYKVKVTNPGGTVSHEYFDVETGFKVQTESEMGIAEISDYKPVAIEVKGPEPGFFARLFGKKQEVSTFDLYFPHNIKQQAGPQTLDLEVVEIKIDSDIEDAKFQVNK